MPPAQLIDLSVVVAYLLTITAVGIWIGRKRKDSAEGYFLGGRSFGWVMIGFSLFATNASMQFFVAGTGKAYQIGIAALTPELLGGLGLTISALVFIPIYLRTSITTLPQFLDKRFGPKAKIFYGGVFVLLAITLSPLSMYTASLAVLTLFNFEITPGNIYIVCALIAATVGTYALVGGLTAVVFTDMIQVIIMIGGAVLVLVVGLYNLGGLGELLAATPPHKLELLRPHGDPDFPWTAMFTGLLLASCLWAFANISMLQRVLAARDLEHAQRGMLLGAGLKMLGLIFFITPGLIAFQLFPEIPPDTAYSTLVRELLPVGLSGLVLASMLAAMMSSQDSSINAMASIVTLDIYPAVRPRASEREGLMVGKTLAACNIVWGVAAAPIFLVVEQGIFDLMLKFGGFLMLPNGLCYLLGRFWRRGTYPACLATLVTGAVLGLYYNVVTTLPGLDHLLPAFLGGLHFYYILTMFAGILTALFVLVSLATAPPSRAQIDFLNLTEAELRPSAQKPWYRSFGFYWSLYLAAFIGLYLVF